jgi:hypothetical protein
MNIGQDDAMIGDAVLCCLGGSIWGEDRFETVDVPFPGAHDTTCSGINNRGVLTGLYLDPMSQDVGFMRLGGKFTLLHLLNPHAINQAK